MLHYAPEPGPHLAELEVSLNRAGFTARVYLSMPTTLAGADLLSAAIAADIDEDGEELEGPSLIDFLFLSTEDPRNREALVVVRDEDGAPADLSIQLRNTEGRVLALTTDFDLYVVGVRIINARPLSDEEIEGLAAAGYDLHLEEP